MKKLSLFFLSLFVVSIVFAQTSRDDDDWTETILGYTFGKTGITFQVETNGCTDKSSFEVEVEEPRADAPLVVKLLRIEGDECDEHHPYGKEITWSWEETGLYPGEEFVLTNPKKTPLTYVDPDERR
jgi:hypothetical protein